MLWVPARSSPRCGSRRLEVGRALGQQRVGVEDPVAPEASLDDDLDARLEDIGNWPLVDDRQTATRVGCREASHEPCRIPLDRSAVDDAADPNRSLNAGGTACLQF